MYVLVEVTIEEVDISGTSVTHLSKEFVFSSQLKKLKVYGCPLVFPPIEVCNQGIRVIREYFRELDKVGGVRRGRIKILVMGTTMAGKTSFVEALESGNPFLAEPDERTIGVVERVMKLDDKIECKVIDSGGHRAYMLTNQLFISDNSLVLIVVDGSQYKFTQQCFRQNIADFLQVVYDRNSRAHIAIVVSKVDLIVDMSREEMSRKWNKHLHTCLHEFLENRQAETDRMKRIMTAGDFPNKDVSERLQFFDFQRITVGENVLLTSAATHEGVVSVKNHVRELCGNERLLPSLHTELPLSWVTVEDKLITPQPHTSVPITDVSYAMQLCVEHGLTEKSCRELLNYLNQVGSILYYSHHPTLAEVLFPVPPFVVTLLKAVFRHDHESLEYDYRFLGAGVGPQKFKEMKIDLVCNGIARISMLLALWSEFHLTADRHVDVFIKLFLALDFGYLTGSPNDVVQELEHTWGRRQITLTSPISTKTTSDSSGHTIEQNCLQEQRDSCKEMISKLKQHDVGLLLPWLLNDEKPEDVSELWPLDIPHGVMQVAVEYSFAYDRPLGLFERLSARCHRHSNYICHWSSGLLMCYGAVTLLFNCSDNTSSGSICLSGRVVKSHHSVGRLWHVLLRCVSDMEDLLQSVPGVLPDRFIYSGSSSSTSRKSPLSRPKQLVLHESWGSFAVDAVAGRYSREMSKHIQALQQGKQQTQILSSHRMCVYVFLYLFSVSKCKERYSFMSRFVFRKCNFSGSIGSPPDRNRCWRVLA